MRSIALFGLGLGALVLAGGCDSFGGGHHDTGSSSTTAGPQLSVNQTPPAIVSAFNQSHPRERLDSVNLVTMHDGSTAYEARYTASDGSAQRILYDGAGNELPSSQLPPR